MSATRNLRRVLILASASAAWSLCSGCGGTPVTETPTESTSAGQKSAEPARLPLTATAKLPTDMPYDVPLPTGVACVGVSRMREDMFISLHARQSIHELVDWFRNELTAKEWIVEPEKQEDKVLQLPFHKNRRRCEIAIRDEVVAHVGDHEEVVREVQIRTSL